MLISLIAGDAAKFAENEGSESIVASVLATLARICFPGSTRQRCLRSSNL